MRNTTPIKAVFDQAKMKKLAEGFANDAAIKAMANNPDRLGNLGIGVTDEFISQYAKNQITVAMDAGITQPVTTPANGVPAQFLQAFLPGTVNVLTKVRKADMLMPIATAGEWHGEEIALKTMEHTGTPRLYSDHGGIPLASFNETYESRQIVRFELAVQHTKLSDARSAATGTNPEAQKRGATANAFEILRNMVAFYGFNEGNGKTYGWLNDPNLPAYVTVANGAGGDTEWSTKTVAEMVSDIVTAINALNVQAGGNIDITSDAIQLQLPLAVQGELYRSDSSFSNGMTVKEWLAKNFPNISVETVPEFDDADAGENVFYLKAETVTDSGEDGGETAIQVVPAKMMALGSAQNEKGGVTEGYTNALAGVFVKRPYAVVRRSGI